MTKEIIKEEEASASTRKKMTGTVMSDKMDKTVVVEVVTMKTHPIYKKKFKVSKRFKAHDEDNKCKVGDKVTIRECKPMSRDKRWEVLSAK